jgi:hypothetical protein
MANRQSDSPEAILTGEDGIDGFEQREEQLVAVLRGLAGTDTDVKVVLRQQVLAAKVRCFSASWQAGELHVLRCVVHTCWLYGRHHLTPERWAGTKAAPRWSRYRDADDLGRRTIRSAHESLAPDIIAGESNSEILLCKH